MPKGELTYSPAVSVGHHFAIHEHWLFFALTDESFGVTTSGLPVIREEPGFTHPSAAAELPSSPSKMARHAVRDRWGTILASCRFS